MITWRSGKRYAIFISIFLLACAEHRAPVSTRSIPSTDSAAVSRRNMPASTTQELHIVKSGDTLYSIAWRYGYDYRDIAKWNQISPPYLIYPQQKLRLRPGPQSKIASIKPPLSQIKKTTPAKNKPLSVPEKNKRGQAEVPSTPRPSTPPKQHTKDIIWHWPAMGKRVKLNSPALKKGISITGQLGQPILAAATGEVVYSGNALLGYGNLIIVKHNTAFLSAYAYNKKLLVKKGDQVQAGQQIATMGQHHTGKTLLHFEIRKDGKPTDPVRLLPTI